MTSSLEELLVDEDGNPCDITSGPDYVLYSRDGQPLAKFKFDAAYGPGYPTVIVPFGFVPNTPAGLPADFNPLPQPYGISFTGSAFDEPTLIRLAYAFEQASKRRVSPPSAPPLKKDVRGNPTR